MMPTPISLPGLSPAVTRETPAPLTETGGVSFGQLVERFLGSAVESDQKAGAAVQALATGETDNLHGVLLQVAQADLSFRLILEMRNRLSDAFQEIMKMQV